MACGDFLKHGWPWPTPETLIQYIWGVWASVFENTSQMTCWDSWHWESPGAILTFMDLSGLPWNAGTFCWILPKRIIGPLKPLPLLPQPSIPHHLLSPPGPDQPSLPWKLLTSPGFSLLWIPCKWGSVLHRLSFTCFVKRVWISN